MAIVFEEKTNTGAITTFIVWVIILGVIAASVYYVFFKEPQLVEFTSSASFKNIQQLSKITINSAELVNNPQFAALKQYITVSPLEGAGKSNPFLGF